MKCSLLAARGVHVHASPNRDVVEGWFSPPTTQDTNQIVRAPFIPLSITPPHNWEELFLHAGLDQCVTAACPV